MHKDWSSIEEVPYCFSRLSVKFQGHSAKKISILTQNWDFSDYNSGSNSQRNETMLKFWSSIQEVPYCFSRSSVKFQGHKGQISLILSGIERFRLLLQFEFTDGFEMIYKSRSSIEEVRYCISRSSIKFQGHTGQKIANFDPNWAFLDYNCSLNSLMGLKWCTKLDVVQKRCPIVFLGHPSNLKVTWTEKWMVWIQF